MSEGYPFLVAKDSERRVQGFAMLRQHNPMPSFSRSAAASGRSVENGQDFDEIWMQKMI